MSRPAKPRSPRKKAPPPSLPPRWAGIGAAAALLAAVWAAHGGCLRATWFLDDWGKIVNKPVAGIGMADLDLSALTQWTYRLAGGSGFACHLGNLVIHLLLVLAVWRLGPLFFRHAPGGVPAVDARLAAFFGALVFAVHPLGSEATHYARARDHELVALFSFLTAVMTLLWLKKGWRWAPALLGAALLAVLSKGPGPAHAALAFAAVCSFFGTREEWRGRLATRWTLYAALIVPLLAICLAPGKVLEWNARVTGSWNGLFFLHALTQARVFWEYLARMAWPTGLCPDHLVAYTKNASDGVAWLALAAVGAFLGGIAWLWRRGHRLAAFFLFMIAANLLLRWLYVLSELMVEYRAYPSLPWLGLLAGMGLAWLWPRRRIAAALLLAALLAAGIVLTRGRSAAWSSSEALTSSIERQYPWQLRVAMERTYLDYRHRDADAALARLSDFYARLGQVLAWNAASPDRAYATWPLWVVCVECNVADCLIVADRLSEAEPILERTRRNMEANHLTDETLWGTWYWERARLENRRGQYASARLDLLRMQDEAFDQAEYAAEWKSADAGVRPGAAAGKKR